MKRAIALVLALVLCCALFAGCGGGAKEQEKYTLMVANHDASTSMCELYIETLCNQMKEASGGRLEFVFNPGGSLLGATETIDGVCADDRESAKRWFSYTNKIVIIKHGKEGSCAYLCDGSAYKVKPFPVQMLKGFGGGDGYASAFIFSLLNGKPIDKALEFATASASMLVSAHSCSAAMPSADAVQAFIDKEKNELGCGEVIEKMK